MVASSFRVLYVGHTNSARSPLAAECTRRAVSGSDGEVEWSVSSAGIELDGAQDLSPGAQYAAGLLELDLNGHSPSGLDGEACVRADLILTMAFDQVSRIWSNVPEVYDKVFTIKEFLHWARRAPVRPPILFPDKVAHMRDKVVQAHAVRKRARADLGFWGGLEPDEFNLVDPTGKGDEAWEAVAKALDALTAAIILLLAGSEEGPEAGKAPSSKPRTKTSS
jgi:protein-tyrosine-phosphatase